MNRKELTRLVSAFLLGDGCLRTWASCNNYAYSLSQLSTHSDYVEWQAGILSELTRVSIRTQPAQGMHKESLKLETRVHPFYTTLRERIYFDSRKTVSTHDLLLLDWQTAAIWYMDDGYLLKSQDASQRDRAFLCTDNYNHAEVILLQKVLYEKLEIPFNIRKRGYKKDGSRIYRLVANKDNTQRFLDGIAPYVFSSFEYKLRTDSSTKVDDEIV